MRAEPSADAILVRIHVGRRRSWPLRLPPAPPSCDLTVSVSHPALATVDAADLVASGYRLVGVVPAPLDGARYVDVLVPRTVLASEPEWWRSLLEVADRAFDLQHGPVRNVLAGVLASHATG